MRRWYHEDVRADGEGGHDDENRDEQEQGVEPLRQEWVHGHFWKFGITEYIIETRKEKGNVRKCQRILNATLDRPTMMGPALRLNSASKGATRGWEPWIAGLPEVDEGRPQEDGEAAAGDDEEEHEPHPGREPRVLCTEEGRLNPNSSCSWAAMKAS